jgi:hypothetical protein
MIVLFAAFLFVNYFLYAEQCDEDRIKIITESRRRIKEYRERKENALKRVKERIRRKKKAVGSQKQAEVRSGKRKWKKEAEK